jgi:hypothetical protein
MKTPRAEAGRLVKRLGKGWLAYCSEHTDTTILNQACTYVRLVTVRVWCCIRHWGWLADYERADRMERRHA